MRVRLVVLGLAFVSAAVASGIRAWLELTAEQCTSCGAFGMFTAVTAVLFGVLGLFALSMAIWDSGGPDVREL